MSRLTKELKRGIASKASRDAFKEPIESLRKTATELALRIYNANFVTGAERALLEQCLEDPNVKGYLRMNSWLCVSPLLNNRNARVSWTGLYQLLNSSGGQLPLGKTLPVISDYAPIRDPEDEFWNQYAKDLEDLLREANQVNQRLAMFRNDVEQLLASCSTAKKLLEVWPEVAPYLPKYEPPAHPIVPINLVERINAIMKGNSHA